MHLHVEVGGRQIGKPQGGTLVGRAERVAKVFDRDVVVGLRLAQKLDRLPSGHEAGRGEVVDLEPLLQKVGVALGFGMPEHAVRHRLKRHRAKAVTARDRGRWQVNATVVEVCHRAGGVRQIAHVHEFEPEPFGHAGHRPVGERAPDVADRRHLGLRQVFDRRQVVVDRAHPLAQLGVGTPSLLRSRDRLARPSGEFAVQSDERRERLVGYSLSGPHRRQPERGVHAALLQPLQLDL